MSATPEASSDPVQLAETTRRKPNQRRQNRSPRLSRRFDRAARIVVAVAIVTGAIGLVFANPVVRTVEAALTSRLLDLFLARGSTSSFTSFLVSTGPTRLIAFEVTIECSVLVILVPLLVIASVILAATRIPWGRMALGITAMTLIVIIMNIVRLALIGVSTQIWGMGGYTVSHVFVGSVIGILGFAAGTAALVAGTRRRSVRTKARRGRHA